MGIAIFISDKIDFKIKTIIKDKDCIKIKGSIQGTTIKYIYIYIYTCNIEAHEYVRQMLTTIKGEIDSNIIIVGDINMPLIPMDRSYRQKINKEKRALNDTLDQLDLIDIYRVFHPKTMDFNFSLK